MSMRYLDLTGLGTAITKMKNYVDQVALDGQVDLSGYATSTDLSDLQSELESAIESAVTGAYTVKGSIAFASLPTSATVGDVYNVTDAFTTTASFVEGAGGEYPAGTNVVWTDEGWDCLVGIIDLSGYVTSDDLEDTLSDYVTSSSLTSTLGSYVTSSSLTSTLGSYVTSSALTSTLSSYVLASDLVAITDDEITALFA